MCTRGRHAAQAQIHALMGGSKMACFYSRSAANTTMWHVKQCGFNLENKRMLHSVCRPSCVPASCASKQPLFSPQANLTGSRQHFQRTAHLNHGTLVKLGECVVNPGPPSAAAGFVQGRVQTSGLAERSLALDCPAQRCSAPSLHPSATSAIPTANNTTVAPLPSHLSMVTRPLPWSRVSTSTAQALRYCARQEERDRHGCAGIAV